MMATEKLTPTELIDRDGPVQSSQERIEEVAFEGLIKKYTAKREFNMVNILGQVYGKVLLDREQV